MKLGIGSYSCAWAVGVAGYECPNPLKPLDLLEWADQLEVDLVQIADNMPLHACSTMQLHQLKEHADSLGIEIEIGTRGIDYSHLEKYLEIAGTLGSRLLRVVIDTASSQPPPEQVVAQLNESIPLFAGSGVTLAIENHDRFSVRTLAGIIKEIDSPYVGICLDTVNSFGAQEGPGVVIETLAPFTVNLHVKDYRISRLDHMMGFMIEGTPAGKGLLDIPGLVRKLKSLNRDPNLILELWPPLQSTMEGTIDLERKWLTESVAFLKTVI
jgi:sugar phosphate isomerase/epimerase